MKSHLLLAFAILAIQIAGAKEPSFLEQVNALWRANDYNQILQLAKTKTSDQPALPEAYAVLFGYHVFITGNRSQAINALNRLATLLQASYPEGSQAVIEYRDHFMEIPGDQMHATQELDAVHKLFPDAFPIKVLLISIGKRP